MNDRELLELAAKAARIDTHWGEGWQSDTMFRTIPRPSSPLVANVEWNPLADDGDALRLAVKLRIHISVFADAIGIGNPVVGYVETPWSEDPYAATRRAIVETAAEIGKAMV